MEVFRKKKLKSGGLIDDSLQKAIHSGKKKWRNILKVVLDSVMFCARNNLPLRGTKEFIESSSAGIFFNLIELINHYNPVIEHHISEVKKGCVNYLSNKIQNKFIELLEKHVRREIISRNKQAKYFSLLFDCTPDISHHEQMCQIIRYVCINSNNISIEESFIEFIETKEKTGNSLPAEIFKKLEEDGINIEDARGQGYDNGANMSGIYKGVQAIIS